jgi:mono/diheme cytochrome c family protein
VSPEWLVKNDCLACHTVQMLEEQRLTPKQWGAVVKKMVGWGAPVDPATSDLLVAYLADHYGPDAGAYDPPLLAPAEATLALAPEEDGPLAGGEPARGATLYRDRCAACHGAEARGQLGVALVDRPLLYRAASFAAVIRKGKGRMDPAPDTSDGEIADLLAHLRAALPAPSPAPH